MTARMRSVESPDFLSMFNSLIALAAAWLAARFVPTGKQEEGPLPRSAYYQDTAVFGIVTGATWCGVLYWQLVPERRDEVYMIMSAPGILVLLLGISALVLKRR